MLCLKSCVYNNCIYNTQAEGWILIEKSLLLFEAVRPADDSGADYQVYRHYHGSVPALDSFLSDRCDRPQRTFGGNPVLRIFDAGLLRNGLGGKCHRQPDGLPGGQGHHPAAAARSVLPDFLSFLPADG